jgi:hypothetical protein
MYRLAKHEMVAGRCGRVILLLALMAAAGGAYAADINVPGDYATIQAAINAAADGDTILVGPGTYNENLTVDKSLTILSTNGRGVTFISANTNDTPIVSITADGVTVGGPNQGFTINQQDAGPAAVPQGGNCAVMIQGDLVGSDGVTIRNNTLWGNSTDEGILVTPAIAGGQLVIRNNTFSKSSGAAFGFKDAIYFDGTDFGGGISWASLNVATVDLLSNTVTNFDQSGIWFDEDVFKSTVTIANSSFTPVATPTGSTYGIYFDSDITGISAVSISNVTIDDVDYGIYANDYVYDYSTLAIVDCTLTDIHSYGIYIYEIENNSEVVIDPCTITGDGVASTGIYVDYAYYGASLTIADNTISGFTSEGIYLYDVGNDGSYTWLTGNTISDAADSIYVGYIAYEGGVALVDNNQLTGFTDAGMYVDDAVDYGGALFVSNNTMTADAAGSTYGFYYDDYVDEGSYVELSDNTISGFTDTGVYFYDDVEYGSSVLVTGNTLTGDGAYEGVYFYYYIEEGGWVDVTDNTISGCDDGIDFDDYIEYGGFVTITGNTVTGFTDDAIDVYEVYEGCGLTIADNTVTGDGVSAASGIDVEYVEYGSTATITGNTISGFLYDGIYLYYVYTSQIVVDDNTITGLGGGSPSDTGIYVDDYVEYGSTLSASNNTIAGCYDGIYFDDYWEYGGEIALNGNTITGFTDYGIYVYDIYEGIDVTIDDNVLVGGLYPIYVDYLEYGSTLTINNNSITDVEAGGYGVYCYSAYEGCVAEMYGNTVASAGGGSDYGIYVDYIEYGSDMTIWQNDVSGFDYGFYLSSDIYDGGLLTITENNFDAGLYGLDFTGYLDYGSICEISYNNVTGFVEDAIIFRDVIQQSNVCIEQNRLIGDAGTNGIDFDAAIEEGSAVTVNGNCFQGVDTGFEVNTILDTAVLTATDNDFSGTTTGINNELGDADHTIDAEYNWWDAAVFAGEVDDDPALAAAPDSDDDGVENCADLCPGTPTDEVADADGCSCYQLDPGDDDGDGVENCDDLCPGEDDNLDTDGDGTPDCLDNCPDDPDKTEPGECGCGTSDVDSDADGTPDCVDLCPGEDDSLDTDGDGTPDCFDDCPDDPDKTEPGVCGCGTADTDTDGDNLPDCLDPFPNDPNNVPVGGVDTDGDGVPDVYDECPDDPNKIDAGVCGCGEDDVDSDGDGILDCMDNCPDIQNPIQEDLDKDGIGDPCDTSPVGCGAGICGFGYVGVMPLMLLGLAGMKLQARRRTSGGR